MKVTRGEAAFASHSFVQIFKTFFFSSKKLSDQNTIFNLEIMWMINYKTMTRSFDVNLNVITLLATPTAQVIFDWIYAI